MNIQFKPKLLVFALCCLNATPIIAATGTPVGKVIAVEGQVYAIDKANKKRPLLRRSELYSSDTIYTASDAVIQFRYSDGTLVSVRPNSTYTISQYNYQSHSQKNNLLVKLDKGGFRTISGLIDKTNSNGYTITTPVETIGVRGTSFLVQTNQDQTLNAVSTGTIQINSKTKRALLGPTQQYSAALVNASGQITLASNLSAIPSSLAYAISPSLGLSTSNSHEQQQKQQSLASFEQSLGSNGAATQNISATTQNSYIAQTNAISVPIPSKPAIPPKPSWWDIEMGGAPWPPSWWHPGDPLPWG